MSETKHTNRLIDETSPYLLQHAHNPVDWYPWGDDAFAKARAEDKPLFLSIGYSACHWCHVMERESFENEEVADLLRADFVAIKVDREERPDVDSIYMQAVQMMNGHGGWPMSVFLTPAGVPFYSGTYFPPDDRHGMPSFRRVLRHVADVYRSQRNAVEQTSQEVLKALAASTPEGVAGHTVDRQSLDQAAARIARNYDPANGGFGGAPKFPPSMTLDFLMQVAWRSDDAALRDIIVNTLTKMARGGIYDQIGGGFHRYSVDARWLVPHFEKMLYDNALLARLYTRAWQWTRDPLFARIAREILAFVERELTSPEGGFYSTLDADSDGVEGSFYVWGWDKILATLGKDDDRVISVLYGVAGGANWEGVNILNLPRDPAIVASELELTLDQLEEVVARARRHLFEEREGRVRPARDEKVLAGWNGWMLAAFAEAAMAFDSDAYRDVVRKNAEFLIKQMRDENGRLLRSWKDGRARITALLEDFAGAGWGLALASEATGERRYLEEARKLADEMIERFSDDAGGFFDTPIDHEKLITRPKDLFDNATPSGNSVAFELLLRLALLFGEERYAEIATRGIEAIAPIAERYPSGFGFLLGVAEWRAGQPKEIALTGSSDDEAFLALRRAIGETYLPHRVIVAGESFADLPLMQHRPPDRTLAYVCEGYACQEPTSDPARLKELLDAV